jgi:hypothetical protein
MRIAVLGAGSWEAYRGLTPYYQAGHEREPG